MNVYTIHDSTDPGGKVHLSRTPAGRTAIPICRSVSMPFSVASDRAVNCKNCLKRRAVVETERA